LEFLGKFSDFFGVQSVKRLFFEFQQLADVAEGTNDNAPCGYRSPLVPQPASSSF
jgi:hypothetical protein